jgi:hypothetical protein
MTDNKLGVTRKNHNGVIEDAALLWHWRKDTDRKNLRRAGILSKIYMGSYKIQILLSYVRIHTSL